MMHGAVRQLKRWVCMLGIAASLPLLACSQETLPLPEGVNPEALPRIIVKGEHIEINGKVLQLGVRDKEVWKPWAEALGPVVFDDAGFAVTRWGGQGVSLGLGEREKLQYSNSLTIFLRRGRWFFWGEEALRGVNPNYQPFSGYLEIDGIPIGPNMSREDLQQRRRKLGLPPLKPDWEGYSVYEPNKWTQYYYFSGKGILEAVQFL